MSRPFPDHPFLTGSFSPLTFEADAFDLPVRGAVPKISRVTLYRNSPNPQFAPRDDNYHWFLVDGRIPSRHRWLRTPKFLAERAAHEALYWSWGPPRTADPSVLGKDDGVD